MQQHLTIERKGQRKLSLFTEQRDQLSQIVTHCIQNYFFDSLHWLLKSKWQLVQQVGGSQTNQYIALLVSDTSQLH